MRGEAHLIVGASMSDLVAQAVPFPLCPPSVLTLLTSCTLPVVFLFNFFYIFFVYFCFLEFNWTLYRIFAYCERDFAGQAKSMPGHISNCVKAKGKAAKDVVGTTNGNGHAPLSGLHSCSPSECHYLWLASPLHSIPFHSPVSSLCFCLKEH